MSLSVSTPNSQAAEAISLSQLAPAWSKMLIPTEARPANKHAISGKPEDVVELLVACEDALNACQTANNSKQAVIDQQVELLIAQDTTIKTLEAESRSILKSPLLWFIVGVTVSSITISLLRR